METVPDKMRFRYPVRASTQSVQQSRQLKRDTEPRLPLPLDLRAWQWCYRQVVTPRRIVRFAACVMRWYPRTRSFLVAVFGPKVDDGEYDARMQVCAMCEFRDGDYCGVCGCVRWLPAKLRYANRLKYWYCRQGRHPGQQVQDGRRNGKQLPTNG